MFDYHIHTYLSNHAIGDFYEYVEHAISLSLKEIMFLDHITLGTGSHLSMSSSDIDFYISEIQKLRKKYSDKIVIKTGVEVDFKKNTVKDVIKILDKYNFDMIGSSIHFIYEDKNIASKRAPILLAGYDYKDIFEKYIQTLDDMLNYDYFDVVCHLDVVKKNFGKQIDDFDKKFESILDKIAKKKLCVEVNTSGYDSIACESYPGEEIIKMCFDKNIDITLSSDAHKPSQVGRYFDRAIEVVKRAGYKKNLFIYKQKKKLSFYYRNLIKEF